MELIRSDASPLTVNTFSDLICDHERHLQRVPSFFPGNTGGLSASDTLDEGFDLISQRVSFLDGDPSDGDLWKSSFSQISTPFGPRDL